jgi:hypothetical protein
MLTAASPARAATKKLSPARKSMTCCCRASPPARSAMPPDRITLSRVASSATPTTTGPNARKSLPNSRFPPYAPPLRPYRKRQPQLPSLCACHPERSEGSQPSADYDSHIFGCGRPNHPTGSPSPSCAPDTAALTPLHVAPLHQSGSNLPPSASLASPLRFLPDTSAASSPESE